ncbi:hypothetical protein D3C85_733740 [compost metagenome]
MSHRPQQIADLFAFLQKNHETNIHVQHGFITEALSPSSVGERALLLMQRVLQTQSQPKLDPICRFLKDLTRANGHLSFEAFRDYVTEHGTFDLVDGLSRQPGWGPKTAALFVRNLGYIERAPAFKDRFWRDTSVLSGDNIRLPVDKVIIAIFAELSSNIPKCAADDFASINRYLHDTLGYRDENLLIWDDLWFWGFITQKNAKDGPREHGWNEAKYWVVPHTPKDAYSIDRIKHLCDQFLVLIRGREQA